MRKTAWMLVVSLFVGLASATSWRAALAADADSAAPGTSPPWARWQGRLSLGVKAAPWQNADNNVPITGTRPSGASLMGDYYFGDSLRSPSLLGGFRATSGLVFGSRSQPGTGQASLASGSAFSSGNRYYGPAVSAAGDPSLGDNYTQPYFGFGYTGLAVRSGLGFSADLGLMARGSTSAAGRASLASQSLDDAIRQMRMTPVLQLGFSYSY